MPRLAKPLTEKQVQNAKPDPSRDYKLTDGGGLYLLVKVAGSKLWQMKYRYGGKQKTASFGTYPETGLAQARKARDAARELLARGTDPMAEKKRTKIASQVAAGNTFDAVANAYLNKMELSGRADRTLVKARYLLGLIRPALGERPIVEITPAECLTAFRVIEQRGTLVASTQSCAAASRVFRFAIGETLIASDPTRDLRGNLASRKTKNHPAITDPKEFGALLRAIGGYRGSPEVVAALKLMAYLFPRPGELRAARWEEFDLEGAIWSIPADRMKKRRPHKVPLPPQAIAVLKELQTLTGHSEFVFPSVRSPRKPISENALNTALRSMGFAHDQMTAHGFRATASTLLNMSGRWNPDAVERQQSRVQGNVREVYARGSYWDERVEMMAWWASHIDGLRDGAQVIPLGRKGA